MAYFRLLSGKDGVPKKVDPFDKLADDVRSDRRRGISNVEFDKMYLQEMPALEPAWRPPENARTFANHDEISARRVVATKPHVIIREDPMFGRRGYAKEIISDSQYGFVVLVIAFRGRQDPFLGWVEPFKPRDEERMYWPPSKVEIVP